jgi:FKBP-type peptidyl-prolyl cis-trans isomerase (trigger factor)
MLKHYLEKAIEDLETLSELTQQDIEDIKAARHNAMFERIKTKEHTLLTFENRKSLIDHEIANIIKANPDSDMETLLDDEIKHYLATMRDKLERLQEINRRYARFVITVGEFYNTLYEEMLPVEKEGYTGRSTKTASLIEVRA